MFLFSLKETDGVCVCVWEGWGGGGEEGVADGHVSLTRVSYFFGRITALTKLITFNVHI